MMLEYVLVLSAYLFSIGIYGLIFWEVRIFYHHNEFD